VKVIDSAHRAMRFPHPRVSRERPSAGASTVNAWTSSASWACWRNFCFRRSH
jgi:hypothetical protein